MDAARITMEAHLSELARARELAYANGQISAAVQAEHYRGKAVGLYEEQLRLTSGPSDRHHVTHRQARHGHPGADRRV